MSSLDFCTAFAGENLLARGPLSVVTPKVKSSVAAGANVLVFDDETGRLVDIDPRDHAGQGVEQLAENTQADTVPTHRTRGRPKLGVVPREVTLLPRHWEWLAAQPGGASVALRRLVEEARRTGAEADRRRQGQESAYRFLTAMAGDRQNYEEAMRALFAGDLDKVEALTKGWPRDIAAHALALARGVEPA